VHKSYFDVILFLISITPVHNCGFAYLFNPRFNHTLYIVCEAPDYYARLIALLVTDILTQLQFSRVVYSCLPNLKCLVLAHGFNVNLKNVII
jgi:hypothetical protein